MTRHVTLRDALQRDSLWMLDEAQQEVTREADGFAVDADALAHGVVDDGQRDRIAELALQHLRARAHTPAVNGYSTRGRTYAESSISYYT